MGTWFAIAGLCLALTVSSTWAADKGADFRAELLAPTPDSSSLSGKSLLPQIFPSSQARTLPEACKALAVILGSPEELESLAGECTASNARFFAQVRGQDGAVASVRFKLNSHASQITRDLAELGRLVVAFHEMMGWLLPQATLNQMLTPVSVTCRLGILEYDFAPERGAVPRFNLTIRLSSGSLLNSDGFETFPAVCLLNLV